MSSKELSPLPLPVNLFDSEADINIVDRRLPHWSQPGTIAFITWRLHDSMPRELLTRWYDERNQLLLHHGIDVNLPDWRAQLNRLERQVRREFLPKLSSRWHDILDKGHGSCILRDPELAAIVAKSLHHFDNNRYMLLDFVVMPNHVHLLAAFPDEKSMLTQCESWKHYTATHINRILKKQQRLWQQDAFDHLVRNETQLLYLRQYIKDNPSRAKLKIGESIHYSKSV
jgi:putative transposase